MVALPFADGDVPPAFPEFAVHLPRVGKGGDKVVYRIDHGGADLALKILMDPVDDDAEEFEQAIPDEGAPAGAERFRRELQGMATTDCPHIIKAVHEPQLRVIGRGNHVWYSEPYLAGGTLFDRMKSGPLPPDEVHDLARCLFMAVEAMWGGTSPFVHRDIKPKNIGYTADGTVVLIDLGVALFTQMTSITSSSVVGPGTNIYAAPEQFDIRRLATIDFRTDLFQIGIVLVECLTGKHPFKSSTDYYRALTGFDPGTLTGVAMSDGLRRTIPRLLASHQGRRFRKPEMALKTLDGDA